MMWPIKSYRIQAYRAKCQSPEHSNQEAESWEFDLERLWFNDVQIGNGLNLVDFYTGVDAIEVCECCGAPNSGSHICLRRTEEKVFWIPGRFATERLVPTEEADYCLPLYFLMQGIPFMDSGLYWEIQNKKPKNFPPFEELPWLTGQEAFRIFRHETRFLNQEILGVGPPLIPPLRLDSTGANQVTVYKDNILAVLPLHFDEAGDRLEQVLRAMEKYEGPISEAPLSEEDQIVTFITDIPALQEWSPIAVGPRGMGLLLPESLSMWYGGLPSSEWWQEWNCDTSRHQKT